MSVPELTTWWTALPDNPPSQESSPDQSLLQSCELTGGWRLAAGRAIVSKVGSRRPAAGTVGIQRTLCGHRVTKYGHVPVPDTRSASVLQASLGPADNAPAAAVTQHGHGIINIWILSTCACALTDLNILKHSIMN